MDIQTLRQRADRLAELLQRHAGQNPALQDCLDQLEPVFQQIRSGRFEPLDDVPCGRFSMEDGFAKWPDLAEAYDDFFVSAAGLDENESI